MTSPQVLTNEILENPRKMHIINNDPPPQIKIEKSRTNKQEGITESYELN